MTTGKVLAFGMAPDEARAMLNGPTGQLVACGFGEPDMSEWPLGTVYHPLTVGIPGGDARFSAVVVDCKALVHVDDADVWCKEMGRVLQPGGKLVVRGATPEDLSAMAVLADTDPFTVTGDVAVAKKPKPGAKVIAYYTEGTPYEREAELLAASLDAVGMRYEITPVADGGGWYANTRHKAVFLRNVRSRLRGPLLYIDADAFVHANADDYFADLAAQGCDFGAHWFHGPAKGHDRRKVQDRGWWMLSGTLFLGDTVGCRRLLDAWCDLNDTLASHGLEQGGGQKNLWFLVEAHFKDDLKVARLPGRYCYVWDKPWAYPDDEPCIIEHTIASRQNRGESDLDTTGRQGRITELWRRLA